MDDHDQPLPPRLCDWNLDLEPTRPAATETLVLRVDLDPQPESAGFEQLHQWKVLSEEERVRARRFVRPRDGRRFSVCRGSLRLILGQLTSSPPQAIAFRFGPGGKPELVPPRGSDHAHWLRFNVTHSDELALIAVSLDCELGVDLERQRTISEAARIVGSYFTADEQVHFAALEERTEPVGFSSRLDPQGSHSQGERCRAGGAGDQLRDNVRNLRAGRPFPSGRAFSPDRRMVALGGVATRRLFRGTRRAGCRFRRRGCRSPGHAWSGPWLSSS